MQHVITIEARHASAELIRRGIDPRQMVRLVVDLGDADEVPIAAINADGGGFDWLADEPRPLRRCRSGRALSPMTIPFGGIVLTVFPFTDLMASKRRPALVVSRDNDRRVP